MMGRWKFVVASVLAAGMVSCGSGGGFPDAAVIDAPPPPGRFTLQWTLTDTNGAQITCDQVGAQSVTVLLRNRAVQGGSTQVFTCAGGSGMSEELSPGIYDLSFQLIGTGGNPPDGLIATSAMQMGIVVPSGGSIQLAPLAFAVQATGGLALTFDAPAAGTNCGPTAGGGSAITTMTITIDDSSGTCQPLTFQVAGQGPYMVSCGAPTPINCIETTDAVTIASMPSGNYTIHIRGMRGAETCFSNNDQLPVPPLGKTLTRTLNLGLSSAAAACQ